ncbi:MBL fold metallo-hydrolase [Haloferax marisrubri]|uniref:MBL fold hydrolase n=1 Tax=Haloferax marisrubri TaxID=1544719 RepID=A0A2P4NLZ1_9EURY|nr:MBL fold metallo-hydrolase [Haloferax marisrubri]POG54140.1 MBL fold hydrolase [Haloferax marisrubri]
MHIQFQHANPHSGRESLILRFDGLLSDQTVCVLVDAGADVDTTTLLDEDAGEYLTAICLTHAHLDHYQSLGTNLGHGPPIYTGDGTARILEDVLETGREHHGFTQTEEVLNRLEPITSWTQIAPGLRVHPIPAGHTPGATGFLFEVTDDDVRRTILVTGDFTTRRAAGYPGFDLDLSVEVDTLVLTAATNDEFEPTLTDAIGTVLERARAGSTVLTTASGLTGVQTAYLLGHLTDRWDDPLPITLVGHAAKLYDRLEYTVPNVTTTPEFSSPTDVLTAGGVTIAGPEVPVGGSSKRLFESIRDDPGATLVQLTSGPSDPLSSATCTTHHFTLSNHPTTDTIDAVVDAFAPIQTIITHQQGSAATQYKDKYDSFVWATDDTDCYTLLDDAGWTPPPWVTDQTTRRVRATATTNGSVLTNGSTELEYSLPTTARCNDVDLAAEGLDLEQLRTQIPPRPGPRLSNGASETKADETSPMPAETSSESRSPKDTETTETQTVEQSLAAIEERLESIESAVTSRELTAQVVDAGDGTILLRLDDPSVDLEHGQELRVRLSSRNLNTDAATDQ